MKKLLYLLLATPIIFLTSCSSGGGESSPSNESLVVGKWLQTGLEANYRYYGSDNVTQLDTSIVWDVNDIILNLGYIVGHEANEDGTYASYSSDGVTTWLDATGVWSATSTMLSIDGENVGTYTVSADNLIVYRNDVLGMALTDNPGIFMDITNLKETFANVDGFGIISDSQTKKKAPGIKQLYLDKKF